ncbi:SixA phosphatase family protein [Jannaschia sp. LMIT008]|uniref:SixA phosphatase family protein n=1 Tax=Jannaschia maritima TaxID=3032585 RepID=UPI002810D717|nr:histidine phosphatase family protein [Jannaschia sp. LMIT008]
MRVILLRHAKSSWDDPSLDDRDRPLNRRGRDAAARIGAWLRTHAPEPDRILVSPAARTRETWDALGLPGTPEHPDALYLAEADAILAALPARGCVLVVGHNDGMARAARRLCARPPNHPDFDRFPTGACLILDFADAPAWGEGQVAAFVTPDDLA